MQLPKKGLSREELMKKLDEVAARDYDWSSGRIFGYVFDPGKEIIEVAEEALLKFYHKNALDFTVYPSILQMENDIISFAASHLGGDDKVSGNFTSGGTESIILAVKTARDYMKAKKGITEPEMVVPITAHAAFHKAAHYLGIKVKKIGIDENMKAKVDELEDAITDNTILVVGSAPSYAYGVIDPIEEMAAIAKKHDVLFHTDACMGGFLLPFLKRLGEDVPPFDFSVDGVTSISMDLHKYAYTPKGASVVLYRSKDIRKYQIFSYAGWTGYTMVNTTIQSTKSTGPLAAAWATLQYVGEERYLEFAQKKLEATKKVVDFVESHPDLRLMAKPEMTLVAFTSDTVNIFHIIDEMNLKGWYIQPVLSYGNIKESIHLSINYSNVFHMDELFEDLKVAIEEAKKLPSGTLLQTASEIFAGQESIEFTPELIENLLKIIGLEKDKLPERFAPINEVLNVLPPEMREMLLIEFANYMFK